MFDVDPFTETLGMARIKTDELVKAMVGELRTIINRDALFDLYFNGRWSDLPIIKAQRDFNGGGSIGKLYRRKDQGDQPKDTKPQPK